MSVNVLLTESVNMEVGGDFISEQQPVLLEMCLTLHPCYLAHMFSSGMHHHAHIKGSYNIVLSIGFSSVRKLTRFRKGTQKLQGNTLF